MIALIQKRKSLLLGLGAIFVALVITSALVITRPTAKSAQLAAPAPAEVIVVNSEPAGHSPIVTATARVAAKYDIDIVARVSGMIESTEPVFSRGGQVNEGDLLLTIDDLDYLTAYAQAESNLARAEQTLAIEKGSTRQAQREWRDLGNQEANDLFLRKPQTAAAEASLSAAQASLNQARTNVERTRVKAPFAGQITDIKANLGQYISTGSPLARLVSTGYLEIAVPLTINEVARLAFERSDEQSQTIQRDVEIIYTSGFQKDFTTTGKLIRFDSVIDQNTQARFAIIEVEDTDTPLRTGELVRVNIPGDIYPDSMWLPESALYQRTQIMTLVDNRLTPSIIELLDVRDGEILVSGLKPGIQIVVERPIWSAPGTDVKAVLKRVKSDRLPDARQRE